MKYRNSEMKVDQFVSYLSTNKINLSPAFQRGHVWGLKTRQALIENVLNGKPIPAVFLYKDSQGSSYTYNILDGKQRLESLILFIGNQRDDLKIDNWKEFFFSKSERNAFQFTVHSDGAKQDITELSDDVIRNFKEYVIPTIEIDLDDSTSLDEIISLFVDINQQGVKVERFQIVKAMYSQETVLKKVFSLVAQAQIRGKDVYYKTKSNEFTKVLKLLQTVAAAKEANHKVDIMWERLLEVALFAATGVHRKPTEILKEFIGRKKLQNIRFSAAVLAKMRLAFSVLLDAYNQGASTSKLASDQTHFYVAVTSLIESDLISKYPANLVAKLNSFADLISGKTVAGTPAMKKMFREYQELSTRQTTDASRRKARGKIFVELMHEI